MSGGREVPSRICVTASQYGQVIDSLPAGTSSGAPQFWQSICQAPSSVRSASWKVSKPRRSISAIFFWYLIIARDRRLSSLPCSSALVGAHTSPPQ
jgi:hypothetical protein